MRHNRMTELLLLWMLLSEKVISIGQKSIKIIQQDNKENNDITRGHIPNYNGYKISINLPARE